MPVSIIEIKAKCKHPDRVRQILLANNALFKGLDRQTDTYFNVPEGRLKLREGNIENTLIYYQRPNQSGPKKSQVTYQKLSPENNIKNVLSTALGQLIRVVKSREIYFIDNVKFHIDEVQNLGHFVEIEAIDETGTLGLIKIREQCDYYIQLFNIRPQDLIDVSYSDMLLKKNT